MRKGAELLAQGYRQLSRKYRTIGRLPSGKTGLAALAECNPAMVAEFQKRIEEWATDEYLRVYARGEPEILELSEEEFGDFLLAKKQERA